MNVAILGTGKLGNGLALRLGAKGVSVHLGSRSADRANARADELNATIGAPMIRGMTNRDAVQGCSLVLLAVPFDGAPAILTDVLQDLAPQTVVVDVTVPLIFERGSVRLTQVPEGSASAHLARLLPDNVALVGALKVIPADALHTLNTPLDCDDLIYGQDATAKRQVVDLLSRIDGLRVLDAGGLEVGGLIERMTLLAIHLNKQYRIKTTRYRILGM